VGIVNEPVEDATGQCGITDLLVPARDRELRGEDGRAQLVAVIADLPDVAALGLGQRGHCPVVEPAKAANTPIDEFERISPEERQKGPQRLPSAQRKQLEERLQKFNQLPAEQQQTLKNMYSRLNQLPPARQEVVRKSINKFSQEPGDRQQAMREELRGMAALPEQERQTRLASPEFRSKFSGKEQEIVRDMADLLPPGSE
jgi:hypothetical protein